MRENKIEGYRQGSIEFVNRGLWMSVNGVEGYG